MTELINLAQIITSIAIVLTFIVYWRQLVALQAQVAAARDASRTQNLIAIFDYIQRPAHIEARHTLIGLRDKRLSKWRDKERLDAERACSAWDAIGVLLRNTTISGATELVVSTWGPSISKCYDAAQELMKELRSSRASDYWDEFEWLVQKCKNYDNNGKS